MKHLKIQHLSSNPKNTAAVSSTQKNTDFRNSKPKRILHLSLTVNMPSPSPGVLYNLRWRLANINEETKFKDLSRHREMSIANGMVTYLRLKLARQYSSIFRMLVLIINYGAWSIER